MGLNIKMKKIDLAYCAGVIDSDGSIGIQKKTYSMRVTKDSTQPTYSERICVKQVEPQAIELLFSLFGGCKYLAKPSCKNGKPLYSWQVSDLKASVLLKAILPFLKIKRKQAINCLELRKVKTKSNKYRSRKGRGHVGASFRLQKHSRQMEELKQKSNQFNKVGK